jgi:hypothetical protein
LVLENHIVVPPGKAGSSTMIRVPDGHKEDDEGGVEGAGRREEANNPAV